MLDPQTLEKLRSELRRGAIVLAVLGQLKTEHYGYLLRKRLAEQDLHLEEGTLYPLVRRLEKQGLLESEWREENKRKKRFYRLSNAGSEAYRHLLNDWSELNACINKITIEDNK